MIIRDARASSGRAGLLYSVRSFMRASKAMSKWIRAINRVLGAAGVELRRLPPGHHADAFEEQRRLLADRSVHTIFDVGANVGVTATRYAHLFPDATIHCFEPFPES